MNKEDFPAIMTISEVAQYVNMHELTVRRLAREGQLPALKLGRQWRIKKDLLEKWLEKQSLENLNQLQDTTTVGEPAE